MPGTALSILCRLKAGLTRAADAFISAKLFNLSGMRKYSTDWPLEGEVVVGARRMSNAFKLGARRSPPGCPPPWPQ